jgi:hypothetical protein
VPDDLEAELRRMADDPDTPAHLKLGALRELGRLVRKKPPEKARRSSASGLPPDPLLEAHPSEGDEDGRELPPDPMADLDFAAWVGREPHELYRRVLVAVPFSPPGRPEPRSPQARELLDAEARFLRECRDRGIEGAEPVNEIAARRRRLRRA